jgi:hypothetical protein
MTRAVRPQPTPNPNALRLALGENALGEKSRSYASRQAAAGVPWAEALLGIPGVVSVFGLRDFLTVTKEAGASWEQIVPEAVRVLETADFA